MNSIDFEILDLSNHDPEQDIILAYVDIGNMPPQRAKKYLEDMKTTLQPKFEERGYDVIYIARNRDGVTSSAIKVSPKDSAEKIFDRAMKGIE